MARLVFIFIAVALLAHVSAKLEIDLNRFRYNTQTFIGRQFTLAQRQKREEPESTTSNILDSLKNGIEETFSEQNMKKIVDGANELGDKIKDIGGKVFDGIKGIFSSDTPDATPKP